jgi:hypothetical protein
MPQLIIAAFILWFLFYGLKMFTRANPVILAKAVKRGGGIVALGIAVFLLMRGQIEVAMGLGGLGAWLLGWSAVPSLRGFSWKKAGQPAGRVSRVRSAMIEMELDHESGGMQGTVLAGDLEGRKLSSMTRPQCEALFALCQRDDPEGARLLEAYLDRRFAGWRVAGEGDGDARGRAMARSGAMSEDEAYEVLGLQKGAGREEVARAHRTLMKKLHPDHGGATNLAARVNEAKDVLMRRHH